MGKISFCYDYVKSFLRWKKYIMFYYGNSFPAIGTCWELIWPMQQAYESFSSLFLHTKKINNRPDMLFIIL